MSWLPKQPCVYCQSIVDKYKSALEMERAKNQRLKARIAELEKAGK